MLLCALTLGVQAFGFAQTHPAQSPDMSYLKSQTTRTAAKEVPLVTSEGYFDNLEAAKKAPLKVVRLNLQNHQLKTIPTDLCLFPNLVELDLSNNAISSLAVDFQCPSQLKRLYVNGNRITEIPARLSQLPQLQVLDAHDNPITKIDPSIAGMRSLKELWLSGNGDMASFQPAIWGMKGLETLRLWNFGLTAIPDAIGQMQNLKTACFAHNDIQSLNPKICALPNLEYLNLGDNALQSLPAEIRQCTRLGYLGIYENPISSLPDDFALLSKSLEWLSAWKTGLSASKQGQISNAFAKTTLMFEAVDIH